MRVNKIYYKFNQSKESERLKTQDDLEVKGTLAVPKIVAILRPESVPGNSVRLARGGMINTVPRFVFQIGDRGKFLFITIFTCIILYCIFLLINLRHDNILLIYIFKIYHIFLLGKKLKTFSKRAFWARRFRTKGRKRDGAKAPWPDLCGSTATKEVTRITLGKDFDVIAGKIQT